MRPPTNTTHGGSPPAGDSSRNNKRLTPRVESDKFLHQFHARYTLSGQRGDLFADCPVPMSKDVRWFPAIEQPCHFRRPADIFLTSVKVRRPKIILVVDSLYEKEKEACGINKSFWKAGVLGPKWCEALFKSSGSGCSSGERCSSSGSRNSSCGSGNISSINKSNRRNIISSSSSSNRGNSNGSSNSSSSSSNNGNNSNNIMNITTIMIKMILVVLPMPCLTTEINLRVIKTINPKEWRSFVHQNCATSFYGADAEHGNERLS
ncbi:hypothetical protein PoB_003652700 [Plakobranchus ocellatus]|uniref:Uncharacterized protein n=1 Tax=Plakobranchus ocellatus TaxID=259542 RepID=A0AAV4ASZ9_9GAST|nr:hypothetical protein PoB_003652700 [Plakobranchus ocellatus]